MFYLKSEAVHGIRKTIQRKLNTPITLLEWVEDDVKWVSYSAGKKTIIKCRRNELGTVYGKWFHERWPDELPF